MKLSHSLSIRHPGESRDPLNKGNLASAARVERIYWVPAFAGMTERR
jgi:hypothetical protein